MTPPLSHGVTWPYFIGVLLTLVGLVAGRFYQQDSRFAGLNENTNGAVAQLRGDTAQSLDVLRTEGATRETHLVGSFDARLRRVNERLDAFATRLDSLSNARRAHVSTAPAAPDLPP